MLHSCSAHPTAFPTFLRAAICATCAILLAACSEKPDLVIEPYGDFHLADHAPILADRELYAEFAPTGSLRDFTGLALVLLQRETPGVPLDSLQFQEARLDWRSGDNPHAPPSQVSVTFVDPASIEQVENAEKTQAWKYDVYIARFQLSPPPGEAFPYTLEKTSGSYRKMQQ